MNEKIFDALTALANKLGTTAEYLWKVLVSQGRIDFYLWIPWVIVLCVFSVLFVKQLKRMDKMTTLETKDSWGKDWGDLGGFEWAKVVSFGFITFTGLIGTLINGYEAMVGLFNPEYSALRKILSMLAGHGE